MDTKNKTYKILLTGGGSGGSVAPLLAVAEELKIPPTPFDNGGKNAFEFLWLGTKFGPERETVERAGIKFKPISAGKWRRYFSFKNLADILKIKLGFWQALWLMLNWRPALVMSAGSFVSVPVIWAAWLLRVPALVHQQDVIAGLANKLMAPFARVVTVAFEKSLKDYGDKAVWVGNPVRNFQFSIFNFQLNANLPVVLILGGGTGAEAINRLVEKSLDELVKLCQIIHVTGKDKSKNLEARSKNYECFEFLNADQMSSAMRAADLVITRAGMSTLSELSFLSKPAIIIPMPESHQEANAEFFRSKKAAVVAKQKYLTAENFTQMVEDLLADEKMLAKLSANMAAAMEKGAREEMTKIVKKIIKD